jgi:regulator of ribonuclease activity A
MSVATSIDINKTKTLVCDVMDVYPEKVRLLDNIFQSYGGKKSFHGPVATVKCFEDNSKIWEISEEDGNGRVLVIDGGGSLRHSVFGGNLAQKFHEKGWSGVIINGCTRDVSEQKDVPIGIKAIASCPRRAIKRNLGDRDVPVTVAGQLISPGEYLYADEDGIIVSDEKLHH